MSTCLPTAIGYGLLDLAPLLLLFFFPPAPADFLPAVPELFFRPADFLLFFDFFSFEELFFLAFFADLAEEAFRESETLPPSGDVVPAAAPFFAPFDFDFFKTVGLLLLPLFLPTLTVFASESCLPPLPLLVTETNFRIVGAGPPLLLWPPVLSPLTAIPPTLFCCCPSIPPSPPSASSPCIPPFSLPASAGPPAFGSCSSSSSSSNLASSVTGKAFPPGKRSFSPSAPLPPSTPSLPPTSFPSPFPS